jgi:hypothetical protein
MPCRGRHRPARRPRQQQGHRNDLPVPAPACPHNRHSKSEHWLLVWLFFDLARTSASPVGRGRSDAVAMAVGNVGVQVVRQLFCSVGAEHKGRTRYLVTTAALTKEAAALAVKAGIRAIDGRALSTWVAGTPPAILETRPPGVTASQVHSRDHRLSRRHVSATAPTASESYAQPASVRVKGRTRAATSRTRLLRGVFAAPGASCTTINDPCPVGTGAVPKSRWSIADCPHD